MKKRLLAALLSIAVTLPTAWAASFTDVPEAHWSYSYVEQAASSGLVSGVGDGTYAPDRAVSNAEWATMLVNLFYKDEVDSRTFAYWWVSYISVAGRHLLFKDTTYMENRGLQNIAEYPEGPAQTIDRYDMAMVIYNLSLDQKWPTVDTTSSPSRIADWSDIPVNYQEAVAYCFSAGFVTGVDAAGTFDGKGSMTRGAAAVVLCRLLNAKNGVHDFGPLAPATPAEPAPEFPPNTGVSAPTVTAVKDMITVTTDAVGYDYRVTVTNSIVTGKLSNGKDITEENINAMVDEILKIFPVGTPWGDGTNGSKEYLFEGMPHIPRGSGCNAFAGMTAAVLYGMGAQPVSSHNDLSAVKAGDVVLGYDKDGKLSHVFVVTGVQTNSYGDLLIAKFDGNSNRQVNHVEVYYNALNSIYHTVTVYSYY